jgi:hypothetical protein
MAKARNFPVDIGKGTYKEVTIAFTDKPDLSAAYITMFVKRHAVDDNYILGKGINVEKSTKLATGECVFVFNPSDTQEMDARSYTYEVKIEMDNQIFIPLIGDWNLFSSF